MPVLEDYEGKVFRHLETSSCWILDVIYSLGLHEDYDGCIQLKIHQNRQMTFAINDGELVTTTPKIIK